MKSKTILSADEMLEILNSQWATVQDIMKIGAVGRNKARDIKNKISEERKKSDNKINKSFIKIFNKI